MHHEPDFLAHLRSELSSWRLWLDRTIVLTYAVAAGGFVVLFTFLSDWASARFLQLHGWNPWLVLLATPLLTAGIVWTTRRWFPTTAGSGIPQVKAALHSELPGGAEHLFVSLRLTLAKMALGMAGFAAGLSIGREGPSVQVAAGVMLHARRWLSSNTSIDARGLLLAGGAAGIAGAFNAPLAGVVFAIEELSGRIEARASGLIITAIVLAGLVAVSAFGNASYFGVIKVPSLGWEMVGPGLVIALISGVAGGLFSRLLIASITGAPERVTRWRARHPIRFAALCGLAIAVIGLVTGGVTFGSGSEVVKHMLQGHTEVTPVATVLKFIATWLSAWCGVPGGIFAPSLSIGAGIGQAVAQASGSGLGPALIAIGMAAFLAAVTQAPLTAFIIVMEMVDGHAMVLSLMAAALMASLVSRMISRPLYDTLARHMVASLSTWRETGPPPHAADAVRVSEHATEAKGPPR
jgi:H+/Cl- antiporter ClcA